MNRCCCIMMALKLRKPQTYIGIREQCLVTSTLACCRAVGKPDIELTMIVGCCEVQTCACAYASHEPMMPISPQRLNVAFEYVLRDPFKCFACFRIHPRVSSFKSQSCLAFVSSLRLIDCRRGLQPAHVSDADMAVAQITGTKMEPW